MTVRVLAAHGTRDPDGRATISAIAEAVAERVGPVRIAWLDVLAPTLADVLDEVAPDEPVVIVPLLLSEGFHDREDIPSVVTAKAPRARVTPALGDDPRVVEALARRLFESGWAGEPVVLGATGSARAGWHDLAQRVAGALGERLGTPTELGVLSGPGRTVAEAISMLAGPDPEDRSGVAVSAYLIAEGFFHARLATAGGGLTTDPIGTHPALIDLLAERFGGRAKNRRMATTAFRGDPVQTVGDLPSKGQPAPDFTVTGADLSEIKLADLSGRRVVLNIFPSIDTPVCAASVRKFNELAAGLDNTTVVGVAADLPFALGRFCGAEGIENVTTGSTFRSSFGADYGVTMADGPLQGLLARSVVVLDTDGTVLHSELVPEIGQEPDYDAAIGSLS